VNGLVGLVWGFDEQVNPGVASSRQTVLQGERGFKVNGLRGIQKQVDVAATSVVVSAGAVQVNVPKRVHRT
jgi:phage baseplate assembly protein gpV